MIKYFIASILIVNQLFALNLENLLEDIKKESDKELQAENQRLNEFIDKKNKQKEILRITKNNLIDENKRTISLKKTIDNNEKLLVKKEALLNVKVGDLGEMFGSVRQTSSDFLANYQNSLSASGSPEKKEIFEKFANSKELPNTKELEVFWHTMLDEIIKSGKVSQYEAQVILNTGEKKNKTVTRIGQFAAVSDGKYLSFDSDMHSLIELSTQPSSSIQEKALNFENEKNKIANIMIDPTKGSLLELLDMNPTIMDRIHQGGVVGYIIIFLGSIGLIFAMFKVVILTFLHSKIKKQIKNIETPDEGNPLGKIAKTFHANKDKPLEDLEITISEAILKEVNKVKKGESFVKLLAAVTPLLGLLGTVTGMIATFQAITLFGTGDPKLMAGGISTALITTVLGLVAAIPLLFSYTYLSSKSDRVVSILEEQSVGMLAKSLK